MSLIIKPIQFSFFSNNKETGTLATAQWQGHDITSKFDALDAIDALVIYKETVHEFTDEIIDFWSLPRRIMERYQFDDAEELNEWLDDFPSPTIVH
jgi:hypothetical protein